VAIPANIRPPTCGAGVTAGCLQAADVGRFNTLYATALGLVDNMSVLRVYDGSLQPLPLGTVQDLGTTGNQFEFYVNDTWRLKPSLTLTLGASYQVQPSPSEKFGRQAFLIDNQTKEILTSDFYLQRARDAAVQGLAYNPQLAFLPLKDSGHAKYYDTDWSNLGPRVASAWTPGFEGG